MICTNRFNTSSVTGLLYAHFLTTSADSDKYIAKEDGKYINASEVSVSITSLHYMVREVCLTALYYFLYL